MAIASADSVGNDVYVAVVVDFGNGSGMSTVAKCVPVAANARDSDALAAAVGSSNVGYAGSGLLCTIDNYPANGVQNCGQSVGNGNYDYWSYWHGSSGSWVYANNGPTEQSVSSPSDDVFGLQFQLDQPDNSSNPPPAAAPSYAQICNASTEVPPPQASSTPATTSPTTAPPTATPGGPAPSTGAKGGTAAASATSTSVAPGARPKGSGATAAPAAPGQTTTTVSPGGSETSAPGGSGGSTGQGSSGAHRSLVDSAASQKSSGGSSSNVLPVVLIAVIVAALGGFALFRWRRRPAEE
jgi:hypothetical protein